VEIFILMDFNQSVGCQLLVHNVQTNSLCTQLYFLAFQSFSDAGEVQNMPSGISQNNNCGRSLFNYESNRQKVFN